MGFTHGTQWNYELIQAEILSIMTTLDLDRMPTSVEIQKVTKDTRVINAIRRHGGYEFWSKQVGSCQSECTTRTGLSGELEVKNILENKGYTVEKMSVKHPYDLLVDGNIKIDVKTGNKYKGNSGEYYSFNLEKKNPTCDIYIIICRQNKKILVIPSKFLHQTQISIGENSKYDIYRDRWDYIKQYEQFYKSIS